MSDAVLREREARPLGKELNRGLQKGNHEMGLQLVGLGSQGGLNKGVAASLGAPRS